MDGLFFKKFISFFLEPYGLIFTFFIIGVYFLFKHKYYFAKISLLFSFFLYILFGYPIFSNLLVKNLESKYPKYNYSHKIKYIHVLGSGHTPDLTQPLSSRMCEAGIKRTIEGVLIYKKTPNSKLIFTGFDSVDGTVSAKLAIQLGVKKEDIIIGTAQKDTNDESKFMKSLIKPNEEFVLVTSASHMPRAMLLFQEEGLNPIAAPTNFQKSDYHHSYIKRPSAESIDRSRMAIHEYIGILWVKLKQLFH